jgi:hypothetical protein
MLILSPVLRIQNVIDPVLSTLNPGLSMHNGRSVPPGSYLHRRGASTFPSASGFSRRIRTLFLLPLLLIALQDAALGWIYPEHRSIMVRAIRKLEPGRRTALTQIWTDARKGHESRLASLPADTSQLVPALTLDYAAWPAIAGDHSCSAARMLGTVLESEWILDVASVAARLEDVLSTPGLDRPSRTNAVRNADLRLLRIDPGYATRAGANNVHFLLARPHPETDLEQYIRACLTTGVELNALGAFAWYHSGAVEKARIYAELPQNDPRRANYALAALADEAFAIHFLQDIFAAGHVAGTRGEASLRKGTHDYYNEAGLEIRTWDGRSVIVRGDAWMTSADAERASDAVVLSLNQFIEAARGSAGARQSEVLPLPDSTNTCMLSALPAASYANEQLDALRRIAVTTPMPGLAEGEGELPRFRAEVGPFIGLVPAGRGGLLFGGFGNVQTVRGLARGLEVSARLGLGLDGVLNESGDGLIFVDIGFRLDAASTQSIIENDDIRLYGSIMAATPARGALTARIRAPFWLVPFDLLVAAPFLQIFSPPSFTRMATVAANGGLLPWQSGIATSVGRFQFVAGREIGVAFYGGLNGGDRFLIAYGNPEAPSGVLASVKSIGLEFPIVEYMPFKTFSTDQGSALSLQLFTSVDIPLSISDIYPTGEVAPRLRTVWQVGVRGSFRWRHYF